MIATLGVLIVLAAAPPAVPAGLDSTLARALVGARVVARLDLPAQSFGIDLWPGRSPEQDETRRLDRLQAWGATLFEGDTAVITAVRVGPRQIEVLLNGGGVPTTRLLSAGDALFWARSNAASSEDPGHHTMGRATMEGQRDAAAGQGEAGAAQTRTSVLRLETAGQDSSEARGRRDSDALAAARRSRMLARPAEASRRWKALDPALGSRVRVRFEQVVPLHALAPDSLVATLAPYLEFLQRAVLRPVPPDTAGDTPSR